MVAAREAREAREAAATPGPHVGVPAPAALPPAPGRDAKFHPLAAPPLFVPANFILQPGGVAARPRQRLRRGWGGWGGGRGAPPDRGASRPRLMEGDRRLRGVGETGGAAGGAGAGAPCGSSRCSALLPGRPLSVCSRSFS